MCGFVDNQLFWDFQQIIFMGQNEICPFSSCAVET